MNFELDDEQAMIAQTVRRFADRELRGWAGDADRAGSPPERLLPAASELGLLLDAVPAAADGLLDGAYSHTVRALRGFELARGCAGLAALLETNVEPALAAGAWGGDRARQALFGALASGGLAALYHDSRGALELDDRGGEVRITGKLGPIPALATASHLLIIVQGRLLLAATEGMPRTAIAPSGWRAARWATAELAGWPISADFVLSRDPRASEQVLAWARASLAARAAGVAIAAMEHAEQYARERIQFGQPIGHFESLIRLHDDAVTSAQAARLFALQAAWALDRGRPDAHDLASRARVLAGDAVSRATIDAVQIYGGYGFVNDYPVEKLMRDARAFEALLGDERLSRVLASKAKAKE
ncbi:MAG: acyl-CoA dehydrogenase family protein [Kofleriaceae bacterium]